MWGSGRPSLAYNEVAVGSNPIHPIFNKYGTENNIMASRTFSVPTGCRQAMTDLHSAHTERYNKVLSRLQQMHTNQKQDHQIIAAFMDTHNTLRGAVQHALNTDVEMPDSVRDRLHAASVHAGDVHSSLVKGQRGPGVGRKVVEGKPVGRPMAGRFVDPEKHLETITQERRKRYTR